jgi:N-acetyl sugar amidotransferase
VKWCKTCLMPDTRPRVVFEDGVCNACRYHASKGAIDYDGRKEQFAELVARKRRHPAYDCIVPFSGGKDSAAVTMRLRELGLRPLLVTYGQLLWTDVGRRNFDRVISAGFDCIYSRVDQRVSRALARRFFIERGHPKQHYDAGVNAVPIRVAVDMGIPLVVFAEHGETEYGGRIADEEARRRRNLAEVLEHQVGDDPRNWATEGISEREIFPYLYPDIDEVEKVGVEAVYFSWYFGWDIYENAKLMREKLGFEQAHNGSYVRTKLVHGGVELHRDDKCPPWWGKSDGSFEGYDSIDDKIDDLDYWMMHVKFGFGRAARQASRLIQYGHLTREQGLELVRAYDGEFPETYIDDVLDYLGMTREELLAVADKHRNSEIWERKGAAWVLKSPPV